MTWKQWLKKNAGKRSRLKRKECVRRYNIGELSKNQLTHEMAKFSGTQITNKIDGFFENVGKIKQSILGG